MKKKILCIDIGSNKICAIVAEKDDYNIKIISAGVSKSKGIKYAGIIANINLASNAIKKALNDAKIAIDTNFDKIIVSISGANIKSINGSATIDILNRNFTDEEINNVMKIADNDINISDDYEILHTFPHIKVICPDCLDDSLGSDNFKLEIKTNTIATLKYNLNDFNEAIKLAGLKIDNIVLSGYASGMAVLNKYEKGVGATVIDIGSKTSSLVIYENNSIVYSDFLSFGSSHITNDLAIALRIPVDIAENIKINYDLFSENPNETIKFPAISGNSQKYEISFNQLSNIINTRAEEIFISLANELKNSKHKDKIGTIIVLTGGMSKLYGIKELASNIFNKIPVRIGKPEEIEGLPEALIDPRYSTAIGLVLYDAGYCVPYEVNSKK